MEEVGNMCKGIVDVMNTFQKTLDKISDNQQNLNTRLEQQKQHTQDGMEWFYTQIQKINSTNTAPASQTQPAQASASNPSVATTSRPTFKDDQEKDRKDKNKPIKSSLSAEKKQKQEGPHNEIRGPVRSLPDYFASNIKIANGKTPEAYKEAMKDFVEKVNRHITRLENVEIRKFTLTEQRISRNITPCQFYQTGQCSENKPVHHTRGKDEKNHYYVHLCDICPRLRNAYGQHMGMNCEFIYEIEKMEKQPTYLSKFFRYTEPKK